jgi:uncharacterized protein (DUF433 family)
MAHRSWEFAFAHTSELSGTQPCVAGTHMRIWSLNEVELPRTRDSISYSQILINVAISRAAIFTHYPDCNMRLHYVRIIH